MLLGTHRISHRDLHVTLRKALARVSPKLLLGLHVYQPMSLLMVVSMIRLPSLILKIQVRGGGMVKGF